MEDDYTRYVVDYEKMNWLDDSWLHIVESFADKKQCEKWFKHCEESRRCRNIRMYRAKLIPDDVPDTDGLKCLAAREAQ